MRAGDGERVRESAQLDSPAAVWTGDRPSLNRGLGRHLLVPPFKLAQIGQSQFFELDEAPDEQQRLGLAEIERRKVSRMTSQIREHNLLLAPVLERQLPLDPLVVCPCHCRDFILHATKLKGI